jgi:UDP-N-acetylmuramate dehydrogenase
VLVEPDTVEELRSVVHLVRETGTPWAVIGAGSNILFDDAGFRGVIVRLGPGLGRVACDPASGSVTAGAAVWVPSFVRRVAGAGLRGCEHAIGIPGTLGGLLVMNGGSQGHGIGEQVEEVTIVDTAGRVEVLDRAACGFSYRDSAFAHRDAVIVEARFSYDRADPDALRREMLALLRERRAKFPRKLPSCGSVFLSDPKQYAQAGPPGKMIEQAGLKGRCCGAALVSPQHANFIVNQGGATSADVLGLLREVRDEVRARTGVLMGSEVLYLAPQGPMAPAHTVLDAPGETVRSDR